MNVWSMCEAHRWLTPNIIFKDLLQLRLSPLEILWSWRVQNYVQNNPLEYLSLFELVSKAITVSPTDVPMIQYELKECAYMYISFLTPDVNNNWDPIHAIKARNLNQNIVMYQWSNITVLLNIKELVIKIYQ